MIVNPPSRGRSAARGDIIVAGLVASGVLTEAMAFIVALVLIGVNPDVAAAMATGLVLLSIRFVQQIFAITTVTQLAGDELAVPLAATASGPVAAIAVPALPAPYTPAEVNADAEVDG